MRSLLPLLPLLGLAVGCVAVEEVDDSASHLELGSGGHLIVEMPQGLSAPYADAKLELSQCAADAPLVAKQDAPCRTASAPVTPGETTTRPPGVYELMLDATGAGNLRGHLRLLMRVKLTLGETQRIKVAAVAIKPPTDKLRTLGLNVGSSDYEENVYQFVPQAPLAGFVWQPHGTETLTLPLLPGKYAGLWGVNDGLELEVPKATEIDLEDNPGRRTASITAEAPKPNMPDACPMRRWLQPKNLSGAAAEERRWYIDGDLSEPVLVGEGGGRQAHGYTLQFGCGDQRAGDKDHYAEMELPLSGPGQPVVGTIIKRLNVADPVGIDGRTYKGTFQIMTWQGGFLGIGASLVSIGVTVPTGTGLHLPPGEYVVRRTYTRADGQSVSEDLPIEL